MSYNVYMRRFTMPFLFLLLVMLLGTFFSASAQAAKMEIAIQDDQSLVYQRLGDREKWLDKAQKLHVSVIRVNFRWAWFLKSDPHSKTKPSDVQYNFAPVDDLVDSAARRGIKLQLTLMGPAPAWATSNKKLGVYGVSPSEYGKFAADVAKHFDGRIMRYSIWNEPNWNSQLLPAKKAPLNYGKMYRAASAAIWKERKANQVLFGELAPYGRKGRATDPASFVRGALRAGKIKADGFAQHPYDFQRGPRKADPNKNHFTLANTKYLKAFLKKYRKSLSTRSGKTLSIYFTEFGQFNSGSRKQKAKTRDKWLVDSFRYAQKLGAKQMLQYQLSKPDKGELWDTSLISQAGTENSGFKALSKFLGSQKRLWVSSGPLKLAGRPVN